MKRAAMEMMNKWLLGLFSVLLFVTVSCDKTKRASSQFIKQGRWTIVELSAGTTAYTKLPKWQIYACGNTAEYCSGTWEHQNGSSVLFYWKFSNIGGDFEFYVDPAEVDQTTMAYAQCANFSGHYKVIDRKRNAFHFESDEVIGYPGKIVTIKMTNE